MLKKPKPFEYIFLVGMILLAVVIITQWDTLYPELWHFTHRGKVRFRNVLIQVPKGWVPGVVKDKLVIGEFPEGSGIIFAYGYTPRYIIESKTKSIFEDKGKVLDEIVELSVDNEVAISAIGHVASNKDIFIEYTSIPSQTLVIGFEGKKSDRSIYRGVLNKLTFEKTGRK